jgi:hypothetical protein
MVATLATFWGSSIWCWRWARRRLRLSEPYDPLDEASEPRALLIRRSLRALMAFNFLIIYPVSLIPIGVWLLSKVEGDPLPLAIFGGPLGALIFTVPLLSLVRSLRRAESGQEDASMWIEGPLATIHFMRSREKTLVVGLFQLCSIGGLALVIGLFKESLGWGLAGAFCFALGALVHEFR